MTLLDIVTLFYRTLLVIVNVVVAILAFRAYGRSRQSERSVFYIGVSCALGTVAALYIAALSYLGFSGEAVEDGYVVVMVLGILDTSIMAWAVCALMKRHVALQNSIAGVSQIKPKA